MNGQRSNGTEKDGACVICSVSISPHMRRYGATVFSHSDRGGGKQLIQCTVNKRLEISAVSAESYVDRVQVHIHLTVL